MPPDTRQPSTSSLPAPLFRPFPSISPTPPPPEPADKRHAEGLGLALCSTTLCRDGDLELEPAVADPCLCICLVSIFLGNVEVPTANQQVVKMPLGTYEFGANLVTNQVR